MTDYAGKRIVTTGPIGPDAISILEQVAPVETATASDEATIVSLMTDTIAIVSRGLEARVSATIIDAAADLRVIGRPGAGYDTVDVAAATARNIPLVFAPVGGFAVAEGALAILLSLVKRLPQADPMVREGRWRERFDFITGDLITRTIGIIGLGRIGARLASLLQPFEMEVLGYDPVVGQDSVGDVGVTVVEFDELLARSDYISVHVPFTDDTRGLIDAAAVARMKKGAIFINTARGGIVESFDVLADGLDSGQLSYVGLDVFAQEPPDTSHRLFSDPRCLFSPHTIGTSEVAMTRIYHSMATSMVNVLTGKAPEFCVNPEVLAS